MDQFLESPHIIKFGYLFKITYIITLTKIPGFHQYLCGYCLLPKGHPWIDIIHYDDIPLDVHGGLTFGDFYSEGYWTGFDCNHYDDYNNLINDVDKDKRLSSQECIICYYNSKIGGCMMTKWNCKICDKEDLSSSTNHSNLCLECARANDLCKHCGADMEFRQRRKEIKRPI